MFHEKHLTSGKRGRKGEKIFCKHKQKKLYSKFFLFIFFGVKNNYIPQKSLSRSATLVGRLFFCRLLHSANCLHSVFCYFAIIAILPSGKIWLNSKIVCLAANDAKHSIPAIGSIPLFFTPKNYKIFTRPSALACHLSNVSRETF